MRREPFRITVTPRGKEFHAKLWGFEGGPLEGRGPSAYRALRDIDQQLNTRRHLHEAANITVKSEIEAEVQRLKDEEAAKSKCQFCKGTGQTCAHSWRPMDECDQTHVHHCDDGILKVLKHAACDDFECPCGAKTAYYNPSEEDEDEREDDGPDNDGSGEEADVGSGGDPVPPSFFP